jgi:hypothetical protein
MNFFAVSLVYLYENRDMSRACISARLHHESKSTLFVKKRILRGE